MADFLAENFWGWFVVWGIVVLTHSFQVSVILRLYRQGVDRHYFYEAAPLLASKLPEYTNTRLINPQSIRSFLIGCLIIGLTWHSKNLGMPAPFLDGMLGAWFLPYLSVLARHFRTFLLYYYARRSVGLSGRVEMSRWLGLRISAAEFVGWATLWGILFLLLSQWFFFGGMLTCLIAASSHWRWSNKVKRKAEAA